MNLGRYKEVPTVRGHKKLIKHAREYLESINAKMVSLNGYDDNFYETMKEFYDFFNEFNNIRARNIDDFIIPDDLEELIEKLNSEFKIKNFKDDNKSWFSHIEDSIYRLMNLYNTIPKNMSDRERRVIKDSVERHYRQLLENIKYYENKFKIDIDKELKDEMNLCINKLRTNYCIYIKTKDDMFFGPIAYTSVSFDGALDLYEQIKSAKHWKTKQKLQKQLDKMVEILKRN